MWICGNLRKFTPSSSAARKMYQTIAQAYEGQSIFMTGGTGFLGKVLLEKLLYSCPGIDKVYLLVRQQNGATAQQRIQKILEQPLFSRIKTENPQAIQKIVPIVGDITKHQLGIKSEDEELLADKVSTVFHMAATIKFNEPLPVAMNINVGGTERVLDISKRMKNLKAFVYVSTAYSNVDKKVIEEILYPAPASLSEVKEMIKNGITEKEVEKLIKGRPNTYTFTKSLAESLVANNCGNLPTVIIRPSIVTCSYKEPMVGWIDNWFGASPFIVTIMKGVNRFVYGSSRNNVDLIPVDYVSNLMILAAAKCERPEKAYIYNSTTSSENPLSLKQFTNLGIADSRRHKFYDIPMPMAIFIPAKGLVVLTTFLFQKLPAYVADAFLSIRGNKTKYSKIQANAIYARDAVEYFTCNNWVICASRTRALAQSLSVSDRSLFPCDPADIDWKEYMSIYCQGIRRYLLKM